jgi:pantoate--beta-alanine ligase
MGFLHAGHVSLITALRPRVDRLVVSIYVNPLQFGPTEDLSRYGSSMRSGGVGLPPGFGGPIMK